MDRRADGPPCVVRGRCGYCCFFLGFTSGALKKLGQGIITRDLLELTEIEVKRWGQRVALTLHFYQYSDLEVSLCFERESIPCLDGRTLGLELKCHPALQSLFNAAAQQLSTLKPLAEKSATADVQFDLRLEFDEFRLSQQRVIEVGFRGKGRLVSREIMAPAVFAYGQPEYSAISRDAIVEKFRLGETMIVHDGSRISLVLDVSTRGTTAILPISIFPADGRSGSRASLGRSCRNREALVQVGT